MVHNSRQLSSAVSKVYAILVTFTNEKGSGACFDTNSDWPLTGFIVRIKNADIMYTILIYLFGCNNLALQ